MIDNASTSNLSMPSSNPWLKVRQEEEYINSWVETVYHTFFDYREYPKLFQALFRHSVGG